MRRSGASCRRRSRSNGTTVRDYRTGTGEEGNFQLELLVYGREGEPCRRCGTRLTGTHTDRRPHHRLLPPLPIVSRTPSRAAAAPAAGRPTSSSSAGGCGALAENRPAVYRMLDRRGPDHLRRQGQAASHPAAHLLPRRLSGRQGGADSVCRARHRLGLRAQRVRRLPRRAAADPAVSAAVQLPRQPDPPGRVHQGLARARAAGLRRRDRRPRRRPLLRTLPFAGSHRRGGADPERPARSPRLRGNDADGLQRPGRPLRLDRARPACMRHEFGFCTGPCAGFVAELEYHRRLETALAFLEGRTIQPIDRVVSAMQEASRHRPFRGGGALAGEVRAPGVAARRHQPGAHRGATC